MKRIQQPFFSAVQHAAATLDVTDYHSFNLPNQDPEEVGAFPLRACAVEAVSCAVMIVTLAFRLGSRAVYAYHRALTPPSSWPAMLLRRVAAIQGPLVPILSGRPYCTL